MFEFHCEIGRSLGRIGAPPPQTRAGGFFPAAKRPIRMLAEDFHALV
jgi:hypothetical protein